MDETSALESGTYFQTYNNSLVYLAVTWILFLGNKQTKKVIYIDCNYVYLADHPEGNDACNIYVNACRMCYQDGTKTLRSKASAKQFFNDLLILVNINRKKQKAYKESELLKQHIAEVLRLFFCSKFPICNFRFLLGV